MENEFELVSERGDHGCHFFIKNYCSYPKLSQLPCRALPVVTRQRLAIAISVTLGPTNLGHNKFGYYNFGYHNFSHKFRKFLLDLETFQRRANITYISYIS